MRRNGHGGNQKQYGAKNLPHENPIRTPETKDFGRKILRGIQNGMKVAAQTVKPCPVAYPPLVLALSSVSC